MRSFLLPAVEAGEGGGRDFHAVELDEGEEGVAELLASNAF